MTLLAARALSIEYDGRLILDGLDLELHAGDQLAIIGRSGSGKTSLLLVLSGLLSPSAGEVTLHLDQSDITYVPQAPSLIPELTAVQNASLGLRVRGYAPAEAEARASEQLCALGLPDCVDALPSELSGGMQQRVALARALAAEPRLLLADEPTGALDAATGKRVMEVLLGRPANSMLVIATHEPAVAEQLTSRVDLSEVTRP